MTAVAIIPARGGSKRIPGKNLKPFHGKPIIAYTIEAAIASGVFDRIVVSTDSEEIWKTAKSFGATDGIYRSPYLSGDLAGSDEVMQTATVSLIEELRLQPGAVCCLYATAPMMAPEDIRRGRELLAGGEWEYVFSAATFNHPVQRAFTRSIGVEMLMPEHYHTRSQDLPAAWHDAAQFYWGRPDAWLHRRPIFSERSTFIEIPRHQVLDIDTPEDWDMAERLYACASAC